MADPMWFKFPYLKTYIHIYMIYTRNSFLYIQKGFPISWTSEWQVKITPESLGHFQTLRLATALP